jgi:hypothetical protein
MSKHAAASARMSYLKALGGSIQAAIKAIDAILQDSEGAASCE